MFESFAIIIQLNTIWNAFFLESAMNQTDFGTAENVM